MRNWKIRIIFVLIILLNVILITLGIFLSNNRYDKLESNVYDDLRSKTFINYVTGGETNDVNEFKEMLDGHYVDSEGNEQSGIEIVDDELVSDSGTFNRNRFTDSIITDTFNWKEFNEMMIKLLSFDVSIIESGNAAKLILVIDKGSDAASVWSDALLPLLEIFLDGVAASAAATGAGAILPSVLPYGIEGKGIEIFNFGEEFTYTEEIDGTLVDVTYDFSDPVSKEEFDGVAGTSLGINNWDQKEVHEFFGTLSFMTDFGNNGDLHQSMSIERGFSNKSNTYFLLDKYMSDSLSRIEDEEDGLVAYGLYKLKWNNDKTKWTLTRTKDAYVDTEGEALLYSIYEEIDYNTYFDRAMEIDGVEEYSTRYVSDLYGTGEYAQDLYQSNDIIDKDGVIYKKGSNKSITFGEFVFLTKTYKPFLRSVNYDYLCHDVAKLITDDVKISELPNINL